MSVETETTWIDAWIRWDRNSKDIVDEDEEEEDVERVPPTTEFSFCYQDLDLTLALKGFPSESEQIWNSTGLTLWPSSHYLCEYLLKHHQELLGSDNENGSSNTSTVCAVELGSGLGRCGLLLHHLMTRQTSHNSHVYMTDGDTDTLAQLRDNVADNTHGEEEPNPRHGVSCHQLLWGRDSTMAFCQHHLVPKNDLDKQSPQHDSGVDLVFGSDLVYSPRVIGPLFETVSILLKGQEEEPTKKQPISNVTAKHTSLFLMAHSDRREGSSVTLKMVLEGAETAGLEYEILQTIEKEGIYIIAFRVKIL